MVSCQTNLESICNQNQFGKLFSRQTGSYFFSPMKRTLFSKRLFLAWLFHESDSDLDSDPSKSKSYPHNLCKSGLLIKLIRCMCVQLRVSGFCFLCPFFRDWFFVGDNYLLYLIPLWVCLTCSPSPEIQKRIGTKLQNVCTIWNMVVALICFKKFFFFSLYEKVFD